MPFYVRTLLCCHSYRFIVPHYLESTAVIRYHRIIAAWQHYMICISIAQSYKCSKCTSGKSIGEICRISGVLFSGTSRVPLHPGGQPTNHNRHVCRGPTDQSACSICFEHTKPIGPSVSGRRTNQSSRSQRICFLVQRSTNEPTRFRQRVSVTHAPGLQTGNYTKPIVPYRTPHKRF